MLLRRPASGLTLVSPPELLGLVGIAAILNVWALSCIFHPYYVSLLARSRRRSSAPGSGRCSRRRSGSRARGVPTGGGSAAAGSPFGGDSATLTAAVRYAKAHGGGTIGVSSQSSAASAILFTGANVAGLGGFSGRESSVTAAWIASEVSSGHLRWVLADATAGSPLPGDTRTGSQTAISIVE